MTSSRDVWEDRPSIPALTAKARGFHAAGRIHEILAGDHQRRVFTVQGEHAYVVVLTDTNAWCSCPMPAWCGHIGAASIHDEATA